MHKVVLLRHGESTWNKENRFTGWTDVDLSDRGRAEAAEAGRLLKEGGYVFDIAFTSVLKRAIRTLGIALDTLDQLWIPVMKSWRLNDCDLYVTLEPCTMCAGAVVLSRIRTLIYGTEDPKAGAVVSTARVMDNPKLNHRVNVSGGILKEDCSRVLSDFFKEVRRKSG